MLRIIVGEAILSTCTQFSFSVRNQYTLAHVFVENCDLILLLFAIGSSFYNLKRKVMVLSSSFLLKASSVLGYYIPMLVNDAPIRPFLQATFFMLGRVQAPLQQQDLTAVLALHATGTFER